MPSAHKFESDQIFIDKLKLKCVCGPNAFSQLKPQHVLLSAKLGTSVARAAAYDRVGLSIDYSAFAKDLLAFEDRTFVSVAELLHNVTMIGLQRYGASKVQVEAQVGKGILQARNSIMEGTMWIENCVAKGEWNYKVEGIEIPIIIGINENVHERRHKQIVCIDLKWDACDELHSAKINDMVNYIVEACPPMSF